VQINLHWVKFFYGPGALVGFQLINFPKNRAIKCLVLPHTFVPVNHLDDNRFMDAPTEKV
jgi:uncharacterized membrane protein YhdT